MQRQQQIVQLVTRFNHPYLIPMNVCIADGGICVVRQLSAVLMAHVNDVKGG